MADFPNRRLKVMEARGLLERLLVHVRVLVDFNHQGVSDVTGRSDGVRVGAVECDRIAGVSKGARDKLERRGVRL